MTNKQIDCLYVLYGMLTMIESIIILSLLDLLWPEIITLSLGLLLLAFIIICRCLDIKCGLKLGRSISRIFEFNYIISRKLIKKLS